MEHKGYLHLLILFLGFSFALSSLAIPTSRSLKSTEDDPSVQELHAQVTVDMIDNGELQIEEGFMDGRMLAESNDYPGTGANHNHDPKTPGSG